MVQNEIPSANTKSPNLKSTYFTLSHYFLSLEWLEMVKEGFYYGLGRSLGLEGLFKVQMVAKKCHLAFEPP